MMRRGGKYILLLLVAIGVLSCNEPGRKNYVHSLSAEADTNVVIPPAWAFGIVYGAYTNQEQSIELVDQIIEHDYPIDAFWIDSWFWDWQNKGQGPKKYMDFVADTISYPDMKGMWSYMQSKNIKAGIWMWDVIMKTGNENIYEDFKSKGFFKVEKIRTDSWHNGARTTIIGDKSKKVRGTWCGVIDFENPEAKAYFQQKVKHFFDYGVDFIKLDRTAAIPVCKAMFETTQKYGKETKGRGFILSHSHGVESDEYKRYPAKWTDDTRSDWNVENPTHEFSPWLPNVAFKENLAMYTDTTRPFHEIPFLSNDMGGFAVGKDREVDEELFIRWLEFAHFVPLTTPFSQPENPTGNIPFKVSERADSIFRFYSHLKMELFPYIYSYAHQSRLKGVNVIRPTRLYEYLFGEELFVAPVYEEGSRERKLELPDGSDWINYWTGKKYEAGQTIVVPAPLGQIPLFVKQGAIIPKRVYARSVELGTNDFLELHVYPGADGSFSLIEDDGLSNDYLKGIYALTEISQKKNNKGLTINIGPIQGYYEGMKNEREWQIILPINYIPQKVQINGVQVDFRKTKNSVVIDSFVSDKADSCEVKIEL